MSYRLFSRQCAKGAKTAKVFYTAIFIAVFLFAGCGEPEPDGFVDDGKLNPLLIGKWENEWEEYTITSTTFNFESFDDWGGNIRHVVNFSTNSGVIIIEYSEGKKQAWTDWDTFDDITPDGNFYGIYFRDLKANSVMLSNTSDLENDYGPTETNTLEEAKNKFTYLNIDKWVSQGTGSAQTKVTE